MHGLDAIPKLAQRFADEVRRVTTDRERAWIAAENAKRRASGDDWSCASHDIYDANESLDTAFHAVFGRDIDASSDEDSVVCNAAWRCAMAELAREWARAEARAARKSMRSGSVHLR